MIEDGMCLVGHDDRFKVLILVNVSKLFDFVFDLCDKFWTDTIAALTNHFLLL